MRYKKIEIEVIVHADESDAVVAALNATLDKLEAKHEIYGGGIATIPVEHQGTRRKSALMHTLDAGGTAVAAVRMAREKVANAFRSVI
jgi:hypothetical protein